MYKAKMTTKGQLTVPKEIRAQLDLVEGDEVSFTLTKSKSILFEKILTSDACPICDGHGVHDHEVVCFFCNGSKEIKYSENVWTRIGNIMSYCYIYKIRINITHQHASEKDDNFNAVKQITRVKLESNEYPTKILHRAQDFIQMRLIREYLDQSSNEHELNLLQKQIKVEDLLEILIEDSAKGLVRDWFTETHALYESLVFGPKF